MSMFDYDARPVTPVPVLVGTTASRGAYAIRDFLSRNGYPFEWVDAGQPEAVRAVLGVAEVEPSALPLCILPDGSRLASATVERVAAGLGMVAAPARSEYDLAIVGAGPAGLGAAVNAASEGLRTVVVEAVAPGGQAGTTSMIENLLGFPDGISGSELATRAVVQARQFGAELLLARTLAGVSADGPGYVAELSDGTLVRGRAVLFASGVEWRRLEVPGIDDLLGTGVYYGAGPSEAATVIVPVTSPAADTVPFPVTWRKMPLTGTSPHTLVVFSRTSDLVIWFNWQLGAPVKRSLIAYDH
jgi:thioredoxin reductase (NADPH)